MKSSTFLSMIVVTGGENKGNKEKELCEDADSEIRERSPRVPRPSFGVVCGTGNMLFLSKNLSCGLPITKPMTASREMGSF